MLRECMALCACYELHLVCQLCLLVSQYSGICKYVCSCTLALQLHLSLAAALCVLPRGFRLYVLLQMLHLCMSQGLYQAQS